SLTCSEEDPGAVVITWICGSETEGMSSWLIVVMMNSPMIDTAMHTSAMKDLLFRLSVARRFILLLGVVRDGLRCGPSPRRTAGAESSAGTLSRPPANPDPTIVGDQGSRSEEHTSELQSRFDLVCRLLLEKKQIK